MYGVSQTGENVRKVNGLVSFYYMCQEGISSLGKGLLLLLRPGPWG